LPRTKKTCSPTPAPTASTATSGRPAGWRSGVSGCTIRSLMPANASSLCVATTSPITRAVCMSLADVDRVADADDGCVDGAVFHAGRQPRGTSADDEHGLADAGVDRVDRDEIPPVGLPPRIDRTNDEQLVADQARIFSRGDNGSDDSCQEHASGFGVRGSAFGVLVHVLG